MPDQLALLPELRTVRATTQAAKARGQAAAERAAARNEVANPGWCDLALAKVKAFACHAPGVWSMEQVREVIAADLPRPTDLRAWGQVTRMAKAKGYIERAKVDVPAASSNGSDKPAYRKGPNA